MLQTVNNAQRTLSPVLDQYSVSKAVREAAGMPVDVFAVSHIERSSLIDREIQATGVTIYEK